MEKYKLINIVKNQNHRYDIIAPIYNTSVTSIYSIAEAQDFIKKQLEKQTIKKNFSCIEKAKNYLKKYTKHIEDYNYFENLYSALQEEEDMNFNPKLSFIKKEDDWAAYYRCHGKNRYIKYCFETFTDHTNVNLSGKIAIDFVERFDKWSKCPMILSLPKNKEELELLLDGIFFCFYSEDGEKSYKNKEWDYWSEKTLDSYNKLDILLKRYTKKDTKESY